MIKFRPIISILQFIKGKHPSCPKHAVFLQKVNLCHTYVKTNLSLHGVFPPIATPFNANEDISYEKLHANLKKWETIPFSGYVVLGSTGEVVSLTIEERLDVVKYVRRTVSDNKLVIAGSGCESTKSTIDLTQRMADVGADASLIVSPCFYKGRLTDDALYAHYIKVADSSPIPVILYSVPANTNIDLSPSLIVKLADHPNIIGLKDSGGDISKIGYVVHKTKSKEFQVVAGSASFFYPALCIGCVGGVLALANPLGKPLCDLHQLFIDGRHTEACHLQHRLIGPNLAVTKRFGIAGVKVALDLLGYYGGPLRSPLQSLSEAAAKDVKQDFEQNGFL